MPREQPIGSATSAGGGEHGGADRMRRRLTPDASICGDVLIPSYRQTPDLSTVKRSRPEVRSPTMGSSPYLEPSNVGRPAGPADLRA